MPTDFNNLECFQGMCTQIFIGKVFWRQELMDVVFHIVLDGLLSYQRWKKRIRPEFDWHVLTERGMELLYRQVLYGEYRPNSLL